MERLITVDGRSKTEALSSLTSITNSSKLFVGTKGGGADKYVGDMGELSFRVGQRLFARWFRTHDEHSFPHAT